MNQNFKTTTSFEQRVAKFTEMQNAYPEMICVIMEKGKENKNKNKKNDPPKDIGRLSRSKFLFQRTLPHSYIFQYIRAQLKLSKEQALFLLINQTMLKPDQTEIRETYKQFKEKDGFLYITYTDQVHFG